MRALVTGGPGFSAGFCIAGALVVVALLRARSPAPSVETTARTEVHEREALAA